MFSYMIVLKYIDWFYIDNVHITESQERISFNELDIENEPLVL